MRIFLKDWKNDLFFVEVEDGGWKVDRVLLVVILFIKFFLFFELVFDLLVLGNLVFKVMILEFEMVGLEGR